MYADDASAVWTRKGATLSDKTVRKEFGLTQEEIVRAIKQGKLQYRVNSVFGNPFLRLIRSEVEALVSGARGTEFLDEKKTQTQLAHIEKQLRSLKKQVASLEKEKAELLARAK